MSNPFLSPLHDQIGGIPEILGPWQLELLRIFGLERDHRVLDLGCGTLRGGLHLIDFLEPDCYFGADPNQWLLDTADKFVLESQLSEKKPHLGDLEWADQLPDGSFDFVLTQSVLNHLDQQGIQQTVKRVDDKIAPDGLWLGTAHFSAEIATLTSDQIHPTRPNEFLTTKMNPAWFATLLENHGLGVEFRAPIEHPRALAPFQSYRMASGKTVEYSMRTKP